MLSPSTYRAASYGAISLASSAMHNVWVSYYLTVLAGEGGAAAGKVGGLTPEFFYAGQLLFM